MPMPTDVKNILLITTADTDILTADRALAGLPEGFARVTAYNPSFAATPEAQTQLTDAASQADVVVLRLLGGKQAMPESFDAIVRLCHRKGTPLIACPGHEEWDQDLVSACTVPPAEVDAVFSYLIRGGVQNFQNLFLFLSDSYLGTGFGHEAPASLPWEGIYHPDLADGFAPEDIDGYVTRRFRAGAPTVGILFYRAHWMSGNLKPIDALISRLEELGANVLPVFSYSLKHSPEEEEETNRTFTQFLSNADGLPRVDCVINTMAMSMSDLSTEGPTIASPVDFLERSGRPHNPGDYQYRDRGRVDGEPIGFGPDRHRHEHCPA